jgi:hypothetical protein
LSFGLTAVCVASNFIDRIVGGQAEAVDAVSRQGRLTTGLEPHARIAESNAVRR